MYFLLGCIHFIYFPSGAFFIYYLDWFHELITQDPQSLPGLLLLGVVQVLNHLYPPLPSFLLNLYVNSAAVMSGIQIHRHCSFLV